MFRLAVLSIALIVAVAPQATLLCELWCHGSGQPSGACQHHQETPSAAVKSTDACRDVVLNISTFVREDGPRAVGVSNLGAAVAVPRYCLDPLPGQARSGADYERAQALEGRPLVTNLRL